MRTLLLQKLLLFLFFPPILLIGQESSPNYYNYERLGISSGAHIYFIKDDIISPVIYKGTTVPFNLNYDRSNRGGNFEVGLSFDKSTLESSITERQEFTETLQKHFSEYWSLQIYGHYLNKVVQKDKFRFLAGARMHGLGVYRLHTVVKQLPWDIGYGFVNFQAAFLAQRQTFKNHWLDIYAAYGLVALTMGNQYSRVFTGSNWQFAGKFSNLYTRITYHIPWTKKLDSGLEYRFNYQAYDKNLPYQLASHQILVALNYRM